MFDPAGVGGCEGGITQGEKTATSGFSPKSSLLAIRVLSRGVMTVSIQVESELEGRNGVSMKCWMTTVLPENGTTAVQP